MRIHRHLLLACLLGAAGLPAWACYTVYDSSNRILYQSDKPPVDMSRPLHETLPQRFPGAHLVFDVSAECTVISPVALGDGGPIARTSSPLLTNQPTPRPVRARRDLHGIAVIPAGEVQMRAGVTVVPSTAMMGGPAATPAQGR